MEKVASVPPFSPPPHVLGSGRNQGRGSWQVGTGEAKGWFGVGHAGQGERRKEERGGSG